MTNFLEITEATCCGYTYYFNPSLVYIVEEEELECGECGEENDMIVAYLPQFKEETSTFGTSMEELEEQVGWSLCQCLQRAVEGFKWEDLRIFLIERLEKFIWSPSEEYIISSVTDGKITMELKDGKKAEENRGTQE